MSKIIIIRTSSICTYQEFVLENEMHRLQWDFEILTNHLISARRPDLVIVNKKREHAVSNGPLSENKGK